MRCTTQLLAALAISTTGVLASSGAAQTITPPAERNAAVKYWATWCVISREANEKAGEVNYDEMGGPEDYTRVTEVFKAADEAVLNDVIEGTIEASKLAKCDFQTELEKGPYALMPHLSKARTAARMLRIDARSKLIAGEFDAAAERIATLYRLSEHIDREPVLISSLVSAAIGAVANQEAGFLAKTGKLTPAGRDSISGAIRALDDADPYNFIGAVKGEKFWLADWMRREFHGSDAGAKLAKYQDLISNSTPEDKAMMAQIAGMDEAALTTDLDRLDEYYVQALALWDAQDAVQRLADLGELAENGAFGTLAKSFAPALSKARSSADKAFNELSAAAKAIESAVPASKKEHAPAK